MAHNDPDKCPHCGKRAMPTEELKTKETTK